MEDKQEQHEAGGRSNRRGTDARFIGPVGPQAQVRGIRILSFSEFYRIDIGDNWMTILFFHSEKILIQLDSIFNLQLFFFTP